MTGVPEQPDDRSGDIGGKPTDVAPPASRLPEAVPVEDPARVNQMLEHTIDVPILAEAVGRLRAADAADALETLEDDDAIGVIEEMEEEAAAAALAEMQTPLAVSVIEDLLEDDPKFAGRLVELMAPDDAVDLIQALDDEERRQLLEHIEGEPAGELAQLAQYGEETAGGMMTTDYLALREDMSVRQAIEYIRSVDVPEDVHYALVTDGRNRLVGILGIRRLLLSRFNERVGDLMSGDIAHVRHDMDREQVAREFDRYDYSMLPVVDEHDHLLGIVTVDDVIDIIRKEQTEDVQQTVGAGAGEMVYSTVLEKFRGRFLWLAISLVMTCGAALVILENENLVRTHPILAFLLPVIAALVGNAGHQALAVTLRGIVLDEVRRDRVWPLILREGSAGLMMGAGLGVLILLLVGLLGSFSGEPPWHLGAVAGIAACVAMSVGTVAGTGIPLLMRTLGIDPARASAIFLIMITDGISFGVLLGLTGLLL